jgi:hypothetical protein
MKYLSSIMIIILCGISCNALSISLAAKQKYPFPLLTEDYGILNEHDLALYSYIYNVNPRPFTGKPSGLNYWQCFPRENISITLEDMGYSSEDFSWKDTASDLEISGMVRPGVFHEYGMRRAWPVRDFQKQFNSWRRLMKGEKYVCLAGHFVNYSEPSDYGVKRKVYGWIFDRLKTKKGCVAYLNSDCD